MNRLTLGALARALHPAKDARYLGHLVPQLAPGACNPDGWRRFGLADAAIFACYLALRRAGHDAELARFLAGSTAFRFALRGYMGQRGVLASAAAWRAHLDATRPYLCCAYRAEGSEAEAERGFQGRIAIRPQSRIADALGELGEGEHFLGFDLHASLAALAPLIAEA
jgi:hypothetical protein